MNGYNAWGEKDDGSKDPFVRGQWPLPPPKPDPVKILLDTKADTTRIAQKLDELMQPPEEGQDRLALIVELLQVLTLKVEAIEARQARLEKAVMASLDAVSLSLRRIAAGSKTRGRHAA